VVKNQSTAEYYQWGEVCEGWRLLDRSDLSVIQERIPPGGGEVRHLHHRARQLFFVISGRLQIDFDSETFGLEPGDSLEVPPQQPHRVRNVSAADAVFLVVSAPTTRGDRENLD